MSGNFWLDWAVSAISLLNTILLFWLGLSVLLNANQRTWGLWAASSALLMGALFFAVHTIFLGYGPGIFNPQLDFWWRLGWMPVVILPYIWYAVMLWYAGLWDPPKIWLAGRHRAWFSLTTLLAVIVTWMLFFANPLPSLSQVYATDLSSTPLIAGIPLLGLIYPLYLILCTSFALDTLRRPGPARRPLGDQARRRALPWLTTATLLLILVSMLVGGLMVWLTWQLPLQQMAGPILPAVTVFDLGVAALITISILVVGQAVVSYEVFTGRKLPLQGLRRAWHGAILLAASYSGAVSFFQHYSMPAVFGMLLASILMTLFFALWSWQTLRERYQPLQSLQPIFRGPHLYRQLLRSQSTAPVLHAQDLFDALCSQILDASLAILIPAGPFRALERINTLHYPAGDPARQPPVEIPPVAQDPSSPDFLSIEGAGYGGARWMVLLRSGNELVGLLLLGEKRSTGLYSQEEIETARAVAERLLDSLAAAEITRRLIELQRERLVEAGLLDQHARRVLHDEVLPDLHAALLGLNESDPSQIGALQSVAQNLTSAHRQIADLLRQAPPSYPATLARLGLLAALREASQELRDSFDHIEWDIPESVQAAMRLLPLAEKQVLFYAAREAMRNAAHHAKRSGASHQLRLVVQGKLQDGLVLEIEDNGGGVTGQAGGSGSGQGLALHSTMMAVIGGSLALSGKPGESTRVTLRLPQAGATPDSPAAA
jgi:signal transduction histidine kinase